MPTMSKMYQDFIEKPFEVVVEHVRLKGLTKLIAMPPKYGKGSGIFMVTPNKEPPGAHDRRIKEWLDAVHCNRPHGPYPTEMAVATVRMADKLVTEDKKTPKFLQVYSPIRFVLPISDNERYGQLRRRIERESMRAVEEVDDNSHSGGNVNAYYIDDLQHDYILSNTSRECTPICGDDFLDKPARQDFIPRITYTLCLFEIKT